MFGFEAYHVLLVALGASNILAFSVPRFVSGREPATSALLIGLGLGSFALLPGMPAALNPVASPRIWEVASELCVIIGLFGTGLRIDRLANRRTRIPTERLLVIAMPVTIIALALVGWSAAGLTLAGGLRDEKSYCAILLDDNNRRSLARLHFKGLTTKYVGTFEGQAETRSLISDLTDIYKLAPLIEARISELEAK